MFFLAHTQFGHPKTFILPISAHWDIHNKFDLALSTLSFTMKHYHYGLYLSNHLLITILITFPEVTALRARIAELEEANSKTEAKVRLRVRREFSVAMRKLFGLSFEQKARIDEYRNHLHTITLQRIAEVREEASAEMARIKERSGARTSAGTFFG